jgi:two-component system sensor histidine kinase and response regulator WspE
MKRSPDLNDSSMTELFRQEIATQVAVLTDGLLALERNPLESERLTDLMRAAHSLKGAARIVGCDPAVRISHAIEDCLVAAQKKQFPIATVVDPLLSGVDLLTRIGKAVGPLFETWVSENASEMDALISSVEQQARPNDASSEGRAHSGAPGAPSAAGPATSASEQEPATLSQATLTDRSLRVTATNLNRLLALAGESLVTSRWLGAFLSETLRIRNLANGLEQAANDFGEFVTEKKLDEPTLRRFGQLHKKVAENRAAVSQCIAELDGFDRRFANLSTRLYQEIVDCRMRPFSDCVQGFPRLVRDLGRSLGKQAVLEIVGEHTLIDRDILELVKAPIDHLLRNALDHGIESAADRRAAGKAETAVLQLEARHRAGRLIITVSDDGCGIDMDRVRHAVAARNLTTSELARAMNDEELLEFLFLPGFTLRTVVSETSGRGVGLDVVQAMAKGVGGSVSVVNRRGKGTQFQIELPLTLSVVRTLVVVISGEPYAVPLSRIEAAIKIRLDEIQSVEGRQHFRFLEQHIGIVGGAELLELGPGQFGPELSVIVLGNKTGKYGLVVDSFIGERELVVRSLDPRVGKVRNISAAALMPDGSPLLIVDVEDLIQEIERSLSTRRLGTVGSANQVINQRKPKHVLVVDDSLTVRELERKLLAVEGYHVDVAVDGMEAWNVVRNGRYDLVLTDVDMPRMDGIELVALIRKDRRLSTLPVMIVSYKDRAEDRQRGLDAGADFYLTKGSFHDQTLVRAVADLIGTAR